jgi:hypothetical protein
VLSKNVKIKINRTIIFPVLCGYETWPVTRKQECRLRVFKMRKVFGPERDTVMGGGGGV